MGYYLLLIKATYKKVRLQFWNQSRARPLDPVNILLRILRLALMTLEEYSLNHLRIHASGLAFFTLLSLVPFLAFLYMMLNLLQAPDIIMPSLLAMVAGGNIQLIQTLIGVIETAKSGALGTVGILTLILVGFVMLERTKATLNMIWQVKRTPNFGYRIIEYITMLTLSPVLLVVTFGASAMLSSPEVTQLFKRVDTLETIYIPLVNISGYFVLWVLLLYAYRYLADTRVMWRAALISALLAGTALKIAQSLYISVISSITNIDIVYGAMALLPFLMVWFYLGWMIFLYGAQLSSVIQNYTMYLERHRPEGDMETARIYTTLMVLMGLVHLMEKTGKSVKANDLARLLSFSKGLVEDALMRLKFANLITPLADINTRYVPREHLDKINLREILIRIDAFPRFLDHAPTSIQKGIGPLKKVFERANKTLSETLENFTLRDLVWDLFPPEKKTAAMIQSIHLTKELKKEPKADTIPPEKPAEMKKEPKKGEIKEVEKKGIKEVIKEQKKGPKKEIKKTKKQT